MAKNLLIIINQSPMENGLNKFKTALSLASSIGDIKVTLLLVEDGIYHALTKINRPGFPEMWEAFVVPGNEIMVERESMVSRKIPLSALKPTSTLFNRRSLPALLTNTDYCMKL